AAIRVHGQLRARPDLVQYSLDPGAVLVNGSTADLHFHDVITAIKIAPHLGAECAIILSRIIITTRRVDKDLWIRLAPDHLCQKRSEEHTSELQSRENLVCRLLLEKKNKNKLTSCITTTYGDISHHPTNLK